MPTPQLGLSALSFVSPIIPTMLTTLSVDTSVLALVINADTSTIAIDVSLAGVTTTLTAMTVVGGFNQFTGSIPLTPSTGLQTIEFTGRNYSNTVTPVHSLITPTRQFSLLAVQSNNSISIGPPTGVTVYKGQSSCQIEWATPTYAGFQGVRVQISTDSSGVTVPYTQYGGLVTNLTRSADVPTSTPAVKTASVDTPASDGVQASTNTVTTTSVTTTPVYFSSVSIPYTILNADIFYVTLTTLVQDTTTNLVYESQAAGPFTGAFVDLKKVNPTDFLALQRSPDIAARMIGEITRRRPDLDLTAHAEIRDIIINPIAMEIASMSTREWFSRICRSISALAQFDNVSGDGTSDPYDSSPFKQQIARAFGLSSTAVQTFIDGRFDILGESAGVTRGGATAAVVPLTFYTYSLPTSPLSVPLNVICSTEPDTTGTAATTFITRGSATISPDSASAAYDPVNGWWAVTVPGEAVTAGSVGQVGEGTINQISGGTASGLSVTNLTASRGGQDSQTNADYAAMIQNRQVAGKDTGSRNGYWNTAMQVPGVSDAFVVASGDVDMLRDWSTVMGKHTFGTVDIYARGASTSQQSESIPFTLSTPSTYGVYGTYNTATLLNLSNLSFKIVGFNPLAPPLYAAVEMIVSSGGNKIWLGTQNARFDNVNGLIFLDPNETAYQINADGTTTPWVINGSVTTNFQLVTQAQFSQVTYYLMVQAQAGIQHVPALQPVTAIDSISGPVTGVINPSNIQLVYTSDFLLNGGSNKAGDTVSVSGTATTVKEATLALLTSTTLIGSDMQIAVNANGVPQNVLSVRSVDLSTIYTFGTDYTITAAGRYGTYALTIPTGSTIVPGVNTQVVVAYRQFLLRELVTFRTESLSLVGSASTALANGGFIRNTWLPASHGDTTLLLDGYSSSSLAYTGLLGAGVAAAARYIKVTFNNGSTDVVMIEGRDFTLTTDALGNASLTRTIGGVIPSGGALTVSYYTLEDITIQTEYPAAVEQVVNAVDAMKHAAADVLVKAMIPSPVDLTFNVVLDSATTPDAIDGRIRTVIDRALDSADEVGYQAEVVRQILNLNGIVNIELPLLKFAKSDGAYNIGVVIPSGTPWLPLSGDPLFAALPLPTGSFISQNPLLPDPTIPSGGTTSDYVGFLYEGQAYRRALTVADFLLSTTPSFYVIGVGDQISTSLPFTTPYQGKILLVSPVTSPSLLPYRLSYAVYGATSANDIAVASSEYLAAGAVRINYLGAS